MNGQSRPRLSEVAKLAGVSTATASRALSNPDLVAESTRKAVLDAAAACGYKINHMARSLRTQKSHTLLVLVPGLDNQFYPEIIRGLESEAHRLGYSIILGLTAKDKRRESAYAELLNNQRADGLVIVDDSVRNLIGSGVRFATPTVQLLETRCGETTASVRVDDVEVGRIATGHLLALGHRTIGHVRGRTTSIVADRRADGYCEALREAGIAPDPALICPGEYSFDSGVAALDYFCALANPPSAIFCANDATALGVLKRARQLGIGVPHQLSVVGVDDILDAATSEPSLTTVRQPRFEIGAKGASVMVGLLNGSHKDSLDILLPHELVLRDSTAAYS